jgi:hypothetical protein
MAVQGHFDFIMSCDGEDFAPIRTLTDPTTGMVSTQNSYQWLTVLVALIECMVAHAHPDSEGAQCVCEVGYYRRDTIAGKGSCEHHDREHEPVENGARCSLSVCAGQVLRHRRRLCRLPARECAKFAERHEQLYTMRWTVCV